MNIKEMLLPDKTYNKFIDNDIRSEGRLEWLERVLQEGLFDHLFKKQWYSEAAYVLYQMDTICREANLPLLTGEWRAQVRSWHLYDKEYEEYVD